MTASDLIFYALAALTLVPALWVVGSPNIVHAGFNLLLTLLGVAGLFAWLGADFLAIAQLMVYVGGVLVLVLFTVMMTRVPTGRDNGETEGAGGAARSILPGLFALGVFIILAMVAVDAGWKLPGLAEAKPTTAVIGANFMTNYIFPFEYVSLVLMAALIGAAILIRESAPQGKTVEAPAAPATDTDAPDNEEVQS